MKNDFIVIAYYTLGTLYEKHARRLATSCMKFNVPCHIKGVENLGSWHKNINYKPTFIREMMELHRPRSVVYVDCDAEFLQYPTLFEQLFCEIAVHEFDRSWYGHKQNGTEILSGTIFFDNSQASRFIVDLWIDMCTKNPKDWDQRSLAKVLPVSFYRLPESYCCIFDTMKRVENKVIVHYQASRTVRRNGMRLTEKEKV